MGLAANWRKLRLREAGRRGYFYLTPGNYALYRQFHAHAARRLRGLILDAGAGYGTWRTVLEKCGHVVGVDISRQGDADAAADLKKLPFRDGAFDAVFCSQVIEHEREPAALLAELRRVVKRDGTLVLTAPHLSRLHDAPGDYYRFTAEGLRFVAEGAGFAAEEVTPCGGLLSFLGHNLNVFALALVAPVPLVGRLAVSLAKLTSPWWPALDRLLDANGMFALNWMLVGRKR
ncbi:MAG: class I SAM-dependent methyltransferase [bacterium]